jgi:hypothetical protein
MARRLKVRPIPSLIEFGWRLGRFDARQVFDLPVDVACLDRAVLDRFKLGSRFRQVEDLPRISRRRHIKR